MQRSPMANVNAPSATLRKNSSQKPVWLRPRILTWRDESDTCNSGSISCEGRASEIAIRSALGCPRMRLVEPRPTEKNLFNSWQA